MTLVPTRLISRAAARAASGASRRAGQPAPALSRIGGATVGGESAARLLSMAAPAAAVGGPLLTQLAKENPYKDVVRYEHKNRKWSLQHVDYYSEALACGLMENGLLPGDVVLSINHEPVSGSVQGAAAFKAASDAVTVVARRIAVAAPGYNQYTNYF